MLRAPPPYGTEIRQVDIFRAIRFVDLWRLARQSQVRLRRKPLTFPPCGGTKEEVAWWTKGDSDP